MTLVNFSRMCFGVRCREFPMLFMFFRVCHDEYMEFYMGFVQGSGSPGAWSLCKSRLEVHRRVPIPALGSDLLLAHVDFRFRIGFRSSQTPERVQ